MSDVRELIIIGGGPAGYTAALYAARANLQPLVIEGFNWGGQLMITSDVENYPGYPDGVMGPEMMAEFRRQAERFGSRVRHRRRDPRRLLRAAVPRLGRERGVPREDRRSSRPARARGGSASPASSGSRAAASRPAPPATAPSSGSKELVVVGGGDTAMEEATFLTRFASKVTRRPPARRVPRLADHGRPRPREPEDRVRQERGRRGGPRRGRRSRACCCATPRTGRDDASCAPTACSSPSATTRTRSCSSASSTTTRPATS